VYVRLKGCALASLESGPPSTPRVSAHSTCAAYRCMLLRMRPCNGLGRTSELSARRWFFFSNQGMDVVLAIERSKTGANDKPVNDIKITNVSIDL